LIVAGRDTVWSGILSNSELGCDILEFWRRVKKRKLKWNTRNNIPLSLCFNARGRCAVKHWSSKKSYHRSPWNCVKIWQRTNQMPWKPHRYNIHGRWASLYVDIGKPWINRSRQEGGGCKHLKWWWRGLGTD
jgi:hypothetical protein